MSRSTGRVLAGLYCMVLVGCSSGGPSTPTSPSTPSVPFGLRVVSHRVTMNSNVFELTWTGSSPTYRLVIGSSSGLQDILTAEVTGSAYTWTAPREERWYFARVFSTGGGQLSGPSAEEPFFTVDMRNMIDAMYFRAGPASDSPASALGNPVAGVWADGTRLQVRVSTATGDLVVTNAGLFVNDYAATVSNAITATVEETQEDFRTVSLSQVPLFTIPVRVLNTGCGTGALACAFYGPTPLGSNRSIVNLVSNNLNAQNTIGHELGHAYGIGHVRPLSATTVAMNFMMNAIYNTTGRFTETEKAAIALAREAGLRAGWTRNQALAAGLVAPYTPTSLAAASARYSSDGSASAAFRCQIKDGSGQ